MRHIFATTAAFALVAGSLHLVATADAQPDAKNANLKKLLDERLATARETARYVEASLKAGTATYEQVRQALLLVLDAELDRCATDKERVAVLENSVAEAKRYEGFAAVLVEAGRSPPQVGLLARADRQKAEITLERARAGAETQPGKKSAEVKYPEGVLELRGTLAAGESARLVSRASGFLKTQQVDIGTRVKRGQVLAVLDTPELAAQVRRDRAAFEQARAKVAQVKAELAGAAAELDAAKLAVRQAEAAVPAAAATLQLREQEWKRLKELQQANAVAAKVVDEARVNLEAATQAANASQTALAAAKVQDTIRQLKVDQAKATLAASEAGILVAEATAERSEILLSFATIRAPFDGVVTQRSYVPGDFIRSADIAGKEAPLLIVERTDVMRLQILVPERDVPSITVGAAAEVAIDALPDRKWSAKITAIAGAVDPKTAAMPVELELPNPDGRIYPGMTATAAIRVGKQDKRP